MIKKTVGTDYRTNGNDIFRVKHTLSQLGLYAVPSYGLTSYADRKMFEGIQDFQKMQGLPVTGVIRPGDKTAVALSRFYDGELGEDEPGNAPTYRCPECGAPHGGSGGPGDNRCPDCRVKG